MQSFEDRALELTRALENLLENFNADTNTYYIEDIDGDEVNVNETLAQDIRDAEAVLYDDQTEEEGPGDYYNSGRGPDNLLGP